MGKLALDRWLTWMPRLRALLWRWFGLALPSSLARQVMVLATACLVLSMLGYGYYRARVEAESARHSITAQMIALAKNLATVNAHFLAIGKSDQIEALTLHTATVDGIYSVLVTDINGRPLSEVVNKNGSWSPRYNSDNIEVPSGRSPDSIFEVRPHNTIHRDFLAGARGTMTAWHRIGEAQRPLGWVRINYRLDTFEAIAQNIYLQSAQAVLLASAVTSLLLWLLLRPSMRQLRVATEFASRLDTHMGAKLELRGGAAEIVALGQALNVVSQRLLAEHSALINQTFALDQHAIVSITDLLGNITYANQRFCDISGYQADELMGKNHRIVKSTEHGSEFFESMWRTISQGQVWRGDIKNRKRDGTAYWVHATLVPLVGPDGLPHHYIGIRTDITANKALEQHLKLARDQAEAATLAKGQFLANMSHEIRTPMNAVLGMLHLLQNTDLTRRQRDYVSKADGAARSLLGLLNDILDFSKIDAGKMVLESRLFRLDKLMRDMSVILSANLGVKPVEVLFDIDAAIPKALMGDVLRLQQVLINLSGNAIKFTAKGEVVIGIKLLERLTEAVRLEFFVRDSGIGIAAENQLHIFDGFSQAEASTTRRFGGTGLGLSISKRLVGLMGGDLQLNSELGKGSTFSFQIRLPVPSELPRDLSSVPALPANLQVLVVDDNPTARSVLASMAESLGWQVDVAASGEAAIGLLHVRSAAGLPPYQTIFVDWQMPGMDGWETIQQLHGHSGEGQPPVVVMVTANGREMLLQRTEQEQAQLHGFLVKPVTASMLYDAVAEALSGSAGADPGESSAALQPLLGMQLLVVEDNAINQQVAQEMLSREGAVVSLADNGQLGVDAVRDAMARGQPFDVVLMDIQMPVMDGYAATRALRQDARFAALPIVAMTANAMNSDREACLAAGMNAHVGKPFKLEELIQLLLSLAHPLRLTAAPATAKPGVIVSNPASESALPRVDAVDVDGALDRLGGNTALYVRVLQAFLSDIEKQPDELDSALAAADWAGGLRLLHTLKGLAATVGARYLAAVSRRAEQTLKSALTSPERFDADDALQLKSLFRHAVVATHEVMQRVANQFVGEAKLQVVSDAAQVADSDQRFQQLLHLLQAFDMDALQVFEQLQQDPAWAARPDFEALAQAISLLEFKHAAELCAQFLRGNPVGGALPDGAPDMG